MDSEALQLGDAMENGQPTATKEQELEYRKKMVEKWRSELNIEEMSEEEKEQTEKIMKAYEMVSPLRQELMYKNNEKLVKET